MSNVNLQQVLTKNVVSVLELTSQSSSRSLNRDGGDSWVPSWKILVYDAHCRAVISPLLTVGALKKHGVTLHRAIDARRDRVPDCPVVYFVQPTERNVDIIARDLANRLYDRVIVAFSSTAPPELLQRLAGECVKSKSVGRVGRVVDTYANMVVLEPRLFTMPQPSTMRADPYALLNGPQTSDTAMQAYLRACVDHLFAVCVTSRLGVPVIRCNPNGPAQMIAAGLTSRLHAYLRTRNNLFAQMENGDGVVFSGAFRRPLLLLLDRTVDLGPLLHHPWKYQALCQDLLDLSADSSLYNKVNVRLNDVSGDDEKRETKKYKYAIDGRNDPFWRRNVGLAFPQIAENVDAKLKAYQAQLNRVRQQTNSSGQSIVGEYDEDGQNRLLASAIEALPEIRKKKKLIDQHCNIATALLSELQTRQLDEFFTMERKILPKSGRIGSTAAGVSVKELSAAVKADAPGTVTDKLRLAVIFLLCCGLDHANQITKELCALVEETPSDAPGFLSQQSVQATIKFVKDYCFVHQRNRTSGVTRENGDQSEQKSGWGSLATKVVGQGIGLLKGIKALLPVSDRFCVTEMTHACIHNLHQDRRIADFLYFDPKVAPRRAGLGNVFTNRSNRGAQNESKTGTNGTSQCDFEWPAVAPPPSKKCTPFSTCITFMVGGGSYTEFLNLQQYCADVDGRKDEGKDSESGGGGGGGSGGSGGDWMDEDAYAFGSGGWNSLEGEGPRVIYGCTHLLSARQFVDVMRGLGGDTQQQRSQSTPQELLDVD